MKFFLPLAGGIYVSVLGLKIYQLKGGKPQKLQMRTIRSFTGANVYSHRPAVVMQLVLEGISEKNSAEVSGFTDRLLGLLPGLERHRCNGSAAENFIENLAPGTNFNHVAEHVALELMRLAEATIQPSTICRDGGGRSDDQRIIIETTAQETGRFVLRLAADLVEALTQEKAFHLEKEIAAAKRIAAHSELNADSVMIVKAAEKRDIPWARADESNLIQLGYGVNSRLVRGALTDDANPFGIETAADEKLTKQRLEKFSIFLPDSEIASDEQEAIEAFEAIGGTVSVKPLDANLEEIESSRISDREEFAAAFRAARKLSSRVLIEERFEGNHYKFLIVGGKVVAANGIALRDVHRTIINLCERAARVIGLNVCEIEMATPNASNPLPRKKAGIVRIKAGSNFRLHDFANENGEPEKIYDAIVEMLFPRGKPSRIPVISITGTNGKTSVTRMTAHILGGSELTVGMTTSTGIYLNGEQIARGDMTGPKSALTILGDKSVDAAVLETARGGIVRRGLGYDWSDVAVLTNVGDDHIGQDGIETIKDLINIKALVTERVRAGGTLIVNADDENSLEIFEREAVKSIPKNIVYFSMNENNQRVREHLRQGGTAYFPKDGFIFECAGSESLSIVEISEIPVTLGGTADFQIANSMAAVAACRALSVAPEHCAARLRSFRNDQNNPGRNNLYKVGRGYALVDYGHNTDGFAAVSRMARRWQGKIVTGIIGLPGDRDNRIIEEAARAAARGFDRVIVTEEVNLRGREPGEMAKLLCDAIEREKPGGNCRIIRDEIEAFSTALDEMRENEVVIIFYRQLDLILEILARNGAVPVSSFEESAAGAN